MNNLETLKLIDKNKNMIYKIASPYRQHYDIEDLYQVGIIGVLKAAEKYKEGSTAKFSTYAYKFILGEILEFIRNDRNIRVNSDDLKLYKIYQKTRDYLSQKMERCPSFRELSAFMEVPEDKLYQCIVNSEFTVSLDEKIDEVKSFYEVIGTDEVIINDESIMLRDAIDKLDEFDRKIIDLRIYRDYTQSETAKVLGISQVQVSRHENNIYSRIREKMKVS